MRNPLRRTPILVEPTEAERARSSAVAGLARTEARGTEVSRVARTLRELREANHFVGQIEALIAGGKA